MAGYSIKVSANTDQARNALKKLGKDLDVATKARKLVIDKTGLKDYQTAFKKAGQTAARAGKTIANSQEQIYKNIERTQKALNPRTFLTNAFTRAAASGMKLVDVTAKLTVALYGVNAAVGILTRSFGGLFQQTIGRAAQLEATLLKTKTTLASTTDVLVNGNKLTDPLEKINALSEQIDERVLSIRKRTLELAGVTSSQVLEVFGIVASQAGQIGASLEEAEDLAINFAGALGTFGIPLRQARQEVSSILQGNINQDSYLAKALGITNEDIQKARSKAGGIVKFLQDKLGTAVAGQAIAAKQLEGVVSNIVEVWEEFGLAVGQVTLKPLISGLTFVFETLISSLDVIKQIGAQVGKIGAGIGTGLAGAAGFNALDGQGTGAAAQQQAKQLFASIEQSLQGINVLLTKTLETVSSAIGKIFKEITKVVALLTSAFSDLAGAVLELGLEQIKSLVGALAQIAPLLTALVAGATALVKAWSGFLKLPLVKELVRLQTTFKVLQITGISALAGLITKAILFRGALISVMKQVTFVAAKVKTAVAIMLRALGQVLVSIGQVIQGFAQMGLAAGTMSAKAAASMKNLALQVRTAGVSARKAGNGFKAMAIGIKGAAVAMRGFLKATLILIAVQVAITLITEAITRLQEASSKAAAEKSLTSAIATLDRTAQDAADGGLSDLDKRLRDIASQKVNTKIDELVLQIAEIDELLKSIEGRSGPKIGAMGSTNGSYDDDRKDLKDKRSKLEKEIADLRKELGIDAEEDIVEVRKKEEVKLSKEIAAFNRQQADAVFARRQELARKEVEIFKAAGELRIRQMEMANKKMIEGEEGVSRTALEALNKYLSEKERGELDIQAQEQSLEIAMQDRAKALEQYRVRIQEQINKMREKIGKWEKEVADYRLEQAKKEGQARQTGGGTNGAMQGSGGYYTQGNIGPTSNGAHFDIKRSDGGFYERTALDRYVMVDGKPLSSGTTVPGGRYGAPRSYGPHAGRDYAFGGGAKLTLHNDAEWVRNTPGTPNGDEAVFRTPDGKVYKILHGTFTPGPNTRANNNASSPPPGQMDVTDTSSAALENLDQKIGSIDERMLSIRESFNALTNESNLDAVAQAFGPGGGLEQLEDARDAARMGLQAVGQNGSTEAAQIEIDMEVRRLRMLKEREQVEATLAENNQLSAEKKQELLTKIDEQQGKALEQLEQERELRLEILSISKQREALIDANDQLEGLEDANELLQARNRLELEGVSGPVLAGELKKIRLRQQLRKLEEEEGKILPELRQKYKELADEIDRGVQLQLQSEDPIKQLFSTWKKELTDTRAMIASLAQTVASELGRAMSDALTGLIDGTKTAEEAFADMFKNIGKAFIDMATQMIAKALVMKVLGIFLPGAGGGGGGGGAFGIGQAATGSFGGGASGSLFGGFRADGGPVDPGKTYVVGENGPELFTADGPGQITSNQDSFGGDSMESAMARWSPGGSGGSSGSDSSFTEGGFMDFEPAVNIQTGPVMAFEGQNYITKDDFQAGIALATKRGAEIGETRTLRRLRMSPSTRRKTGF